MIERAFEQPVRTVSGFVSESKTGRVARVGVRSTGIIELDGIAVTMEDIASALERLSRENGAVWYWRENPAQQPPKEQWEASKAVLDCVAKNRLPIRLFLDRAFSQPVRIDVPRGGQPA